jgi:hypothetical protein
MLLISQPARVLARNSPRQPAYRRIEYVTGRLHVPHTDPVAGSLALELGLSPLVTLEKQSAGHSEGASVRRSFQAPGCAARRRALPFHTSRLPITNRMVSDPVITNAVANPQQIPCRPDGLTRRLASAYRGPSPRHGHHARFRQWSSGTVLSIAKNR